MRPHLRGIDHCVVLVKDIDAARDTYMRLGFSLTPRGFHSIGTQNHCLMFERDYVELLAVVDPHPVTQYFVDFLATAEGLGALALATDDAIAVHASLRADGIEADSPVNFSRPVDRPGGARDARFGIVQLPPHATPGCRTFLCQHFTPELVWLPEHQSHPLGVTGITGVTIVTDDLPATAAAYGRVLGEVPTAQDHGRQIGFGAATLHITERADPPTRLASVALAARGVPMLAALHLRVRDRAAAGEVLRQGGFSPLQLADGALAIDAHQAHGVALVFEQ